MASGSTNGQAGVGGRHVERAGGRSAVAVLDAERHDHRLLAALDGDLRRRRSRVGDARGCVDVGDHEVLERAVGVVGAGRRAGRGPVCGRPAESTSAVTVRAVAGRAEGVGDDRRVVEAGLGAQRSAWSGCCRDRRSGGRRPRRCGPSARVVTRASTSIGPVGERSRTPAGGSTRAIVTRLPAATRSLASTSTTAGAPGRDGDARRRRPAAAAAAPGGAIDDPRRAGRRSRRGESVIR